MNNLNTKLSIILLTILLSFNLSAQTVATVGISAGSFCGFTQIQTAIDSGADEVRVLNNQIFDANLIIDSSIVLKGGYPNCAAAASDQPNGITTKIDAATAAGSPAILIENTNNNTYVRLDRLTLRNATGSGTNGGGLRINGTDGLIEIFNSFISGNSANDGGGIHASNANSGTLRVILNNSKVLNNSAVEQGGGIRCSGSNTFITVQNNSGIYLNQAGTYGGGLFATNGCTVTVSSGDDARTDITFSGVVRNTAVLDGGGVYAYESAKVIFQGNRYNFGLSGNSTQPATLAENEAGDNGGGIAASNDSEVELYDTLVWGNSTINEGGGIYLDNASSLIMTTSDQDTCWNPGMCSILAQNQADLGGAIYQTRGSTATINKSHLYQNIANWGLVIFSREDGAVGTDTKFYNNMIYKHGNGAFDYGDRYLFRGFEPVTMELIHNTITNNDVGNSTSIIGASMGANFTVKNSIIHNPGETVYSENSNPNNDISAECLLVNEQSSFSGTNINTELPSFVNPTADDYHISDGSEATDLCAAINGFTYDIDGEARGFDAPIGNAQGPYDAGADETYDSDIIFKQGFEYDGDI